MTKGAEATNNKIWYVGFYNNLVDTPDILSMCNYDVFCDKTKLKNMLRKDDHLVLASPYSLFDFDIAEFLDMVEQYHLTVHFAESVHASGSETNVSLQMMLGMFEFMKNEPSKVISLLKDLQEAP